MATSCIDNGKAVPNLLASPFNRNGAFLGITRGIHHYASVTQSMLEKLVRTEHDEETKKKMVKMARELTAEEEFGALMKRKNEILDKQLFRDDSITHLFQSEIGYSPCISFLHPGTMLMANTKTKAEFWRMDLDTAGRAKMHTWITNKALELSKIYKGKIVGLLFPFKFKGKFKGEANADSYGMMCIEPCKFMWSTSGIWTKTSDNKSDGGVSDAKGDEADGNMAVVEISVFQETLKDLKLDTVEDTSNLSFVSDLSQFVTKTKQRKRCIETMTVNDVNKFLDAYNFNSTVLRQMKINGRLLRKFFGIRWAANSNAESKNRYCEMLRMPLYELDRLLTAVSILQRRNPHLERREDSRENIAQIEFMNYVKPIIRVGKAVPLEREIRASAEAFMSVITQQDTVPDLKAELAKRLARQETVPDLNLPKRIELTKRAKMTTVTNSNSSSPCTLIRMPVRSADDEDEVAQLE